MAGIDKNLRWAGIVLLLAILLPFIPGVSDYRIFQLTLVLVYAIALLGLNVLTGYNGQFSLGHGAFYAVGAYVAAIMMDKWGMPYYATVPAADSAMMPASWAARRAPSVEVVRMPGTRCACSSCRIWTSHSTSLSDPGPSFRCRAGSAP